MGSHFGKLAITIMGVLVIAACSGPAVTAAPTSVPPQPSATVVQKPTATNVPPTTAPTQTASAAAPTSQVVANGAVVNVAKSALGQILVDAKGMTMYSFAKDVGGVSACYDACATNWPPLMTTDKPLAGAGVDVTMLGTAARQDGSLQVTYNKMPLYYFARDKTPGETAGQGVGTVWFVVAPSGNMVKPDQAATNTPSATNTPTATKTPAAANTPSATSIPVPTSTPASVGAIGGPGQTVDVSVLDFEFSPKLLTVKAGTTLKWTNQGQTNHNVTSDDGKFPTVALSAGQSATTAFDQAGTYHYFCSLHGGAGGAGMSGTIIVVQ
jgi:predicted lipoprotein with Yx(FWY)xxD motif/plastocyanin